VEFTRAGPRSAGGPPGGGYGGGGGGGWGGPPPGYGGGYGGPPPSYYGMRGPPQRDMLCVTFLLSAGAITLRSCGEVLQHLCAAVAILQALATAPSMLLLSAAGPKATMCTCSCGISRRLRCRVARFASLLLAACMSRFAALSLLHALSGARAVAARRAPQLSLLHVPVAAAHLHAPLACRSLA